MAALGLAVSLLVPWPGASSYLVTTPTQNTAGPGVIKVVPVPLSSIRVHPNPDPMTNEALYLRQQLNLEYLVSLDIPRLVCPFNLTADNGTKADCTEYSENHGHWFQGHFLSAAAMMVSATGNSTLAAHAARMVELLAQLQRPDGYLGAWPDGVFDDLEAGRKLRDDVSVPYYDVHKMFAGMLDQYTLLGDTNALVVATKLAGYFLARISAFVASHGAEAWQRVLSVEWGGMNEAAYNLYAITGNVSDLALGNFFEKQTFAIPLASFKDMLAGQHANTHIPQVIGAARGYEVTQNASKQAMSKFFFETVVTTRAYATGNGNPHEHWFAANLVGSRCVADTAKDPECVLENVIAARTEEGCTTYNMRKVANHLFGWSVDPALMDYSERLVFSSLLAHYNWKDGRKLYYLPLGVLPQPASTGAKYAGQGFQKMWMDPFRGFLCCQGTMTESFSKVAEAAYHVPAVPPPAAVAELYISQFITSTVVTADGVTVVQRSVFPEHPNGTTALAVRCGANHSTLRLMLRLPGWADTGRNVVEVNGTGVPAELAQRNGTYLPLAIPGCNAGTAQVTAYFPQRLTIVPINDARAPFRRVFAVMFGPTMLVALANASLVPSALLDAPVDTWMRRRDPVAAPAVAAVVGSNGIAFELRNGTAGSVWMVPLSRVTTEFYAPYLNASLPSIRPRSTQRASAHNAGVGVAATPPRGWNSWDSFGTRVTEAAFVDNARQVAEHLLPFGYNTMTVDMFWYSPWGTNVSLDAWCRPQPNASFWPSSADGSGFRAVAFKLEQLGLQLGLHIVAGVQKEALAKNCEVYGAPGVRIADIVKKQEWGNAWGLDLTKHGAQEYYNSLIDMYAGWGVTFLKMDGVFGTGPDVEDIRGIAAGIDALIATNGSEYAITLSLSAGGDVAAARQVLPYANMYRISHDWHGSWGAMLDEHFPQAYRMSTSGLIGANGSHGKSWPDHDMLTPVLSHDDAESSTQLVLWGIARSPLIWGGDLRPAGCDSCTKEHPAKNAATWPLGVAVLTNTEWLAVNANSANNREVWNRSCFPDLVKPRPHAVTYANTTVVWTADMAPEAAGVRAVALFNLCGPEILRKGQDYSAFARNVTVTFAELGLPEASRCGVRDVWNRTDVGVRTRGVSVTLAPHAAALLRLENCTAS